MALIFFDLDGTTLHNGKPAKGVIEAINLLKENNHIVAIATGRSPCVLEGKNQELGIDYLVLSNGAYVAHKGEVIYERSFPNELTQKLMNYVDKEKIDLVFEYLDSYTAYRKDTEAVDQFSDIFDIERPKLDHNFYPDKSVYASIVFNHDRIDDLKESFPEFIFNLSNAMGYDINLAGGLKADGVKKLIEHLNFPIEDTYALGDGHNDITMIKAVKHGIAMGNASQEVKDAAEYVTTDVSDYGVKNALKHYKLI